MSSISLLPKKQAYNWLTYLVYKLEACFFCRETTWTHVLTQISEKTDYLITIISTYYYLLKIYTFKDTFRVFSRVSTRYYFHFSLEILEECYHMYLHKLNRDFSRKAKDLLNNYKLFTSALRICIMRILQCECMQLL